MFSKFWVEKTWKLISKYKSHQIVLIFFSYFLEYYDLGQKYYSVFFFVFIELDI